MGERIKKNGKVNARLHLIFENGTESDMLLRSLATELYKDKSGRRVLPSQVAAREKLTNIDKDDIETGFIYILQTLSSNPSLKKIKNLYKIGFSTTSMEKRLAKAESEPTYLMAPVNLIATYKCFNVNSQKLENLLHIFFGNSCLDTEVYDKHGNLFKPREWFIAPLREIELAVKLLINGEIVNYKYDSSKEEIIEK